MQIAEAVEKEVEDYESNIFEEKVKVITEISEVV
jgi:hypothetical protein